MANGRAVARFSSRERCRALFNLYTYELLKIVNFRPFIIRKQLFVGGIAIVSGFLDSEPYTLCESRSQTCVKTCIIVQRVLESKCNTIEKETMLTLK